MKKATKTLLIIATSLVLSGVIIFIALLIGLKWNYTKISNVEYEDITCEIDKDFDNIVVDTDVANVEFKLSDDACKVEFHVPKDAISSAVVKDDKLSIELFQKSNTFSLVYLDLSSPLITVYLPKKEYNDLFIDVTTGDVNIPSDFGFDDVNILINTGDLDYLADAFNKFNVEITTGDILIDTITSDLIAITTTTGNIDISNIDNDSDINANLVTGDISIKNVSCHNLVLDGTTADVDLSSVVVKDNLDIGLVTGDVTFNKSDAGNIDIKVNTGDVTGSLLSDKDFSVNTNTGNVDVPNSVIGDKCRININSGDVEIEVVTLKR